MVLLRKVWLLRGGQVPTTWIPKRLPVTRGLRVGNNLRHLGLRTAQKRLNLIKSGGGTLPRGIVLAATNLRVLRIQLRHLGCSALLLQLGG